MLMDRAELLDAMENISNKINSLKETLAKTSDPDTANALRIKLKGLLNTHFELIDQLG
jgi:hypothetical protein